MLNAAQKIIPLHTLNVLLVEDNDSDAFLVQTMLEEDIHSFFDLTRARSEAEAMAMLQTHAFDVCLLDVELPDSSELSTFTRLQAYAPQMPIIMLTMVDDDKLARKAVSRGAQDYLTKDKADGAQLKRAIDYSIERKHCEGNLALLAKYDQLTGLVNRSLFHTRLKMALARAERNKSGLALFFMDLDGFKAINDRFGHDAGDALLKETAARFRQIFRTYDTVARFGGDEFAALLEDVSTPRDCAVIATKIIEIMNTPISLHSQLQKVGISIGIATLFAGEHCAQEMLISHADTAMYMAKEDKGSSYRFYTPALHSEAQTRLKMESELRNALEKNQLLLHYQPRFDMTQRKIIGAEVLVRWQHPTRGVLLPHEFMHVARDTGLMADIDKWVMEAACHDMQYMCKKNMEPVPLAINLSSQLLHADDTAIWLEACLKRHQLEPSLLALEISEEVAINTDANVEKVLSELKRRGFSIHLDNFGARTASLQALQALPLDMVKLDASLIKSMQTDMGSRALVNTIIEIAHQFSVRISAMGVETMWQEEHLGTQSCDELQGFSLSSPLPFNQFLSQLKNIKTYA